MQPNTVKNFNLPNILSSLRVVLLPILYVFALIGMHLEFLIAYIIIGSTDALDGFLARLLNQVTKLGKFLDTVADILFYFSTLFFITYFYPDRIIPNTWLIIVFMIIYLGAFIISIVKTGKPMQIHTTHLRINATLVYFLVILSYFFDTTFVVTAILISFIIGYIEEIAIFIKFGSVDQDTKSYRSLMQKEKHSK
ncbi:MAG: CDP-alcohol phosphatidyltransferase family protein [Acholeplasmataceae bacterium]